MTIKDPDILFLLNLTTTQRAALLTASSTLALIYTPANEHFGIVPVEAMSSGRPALACNSGGPTESTVDEPPTARTGWLRAPEAPGLAVVLNEIAGMAPSERSALVGRARALWDGRYGAEAGEGTRRGYGDGSGARPGHTLVWIVRCSSSRFVRFTLWQHPCMSMSHDQLISWLPCEQRNCNAQLSSFGGTNADLIGPKDLFSLRYLVLLY